MLSIDMQEIAAPVSNNHLQDNPEILDSLRLDQRSGGVFRLDIIYFQKN
jgi:hypothetical protein